MTTVLAGERPVPAVERDRADDLLGAVVPVRLPVVRPANGGQAGRLDNVVPFVRPRRDPAVGDAIAPTMTADDRPAPRPPAPLRSRAVLVSVLSIAAHAAVLAAFLREPAPQASIGLVVVSAELVLGGDTAAGIASTASTSEIDSSPQPVAETPDDTVTATARADDPAQPEPPRPVADAPAPEPPAAAAMAETPPPTLALVPTPQHEEPIASASAPAPEPAEVHVAPPPAPAAEAEPPPKPVAAATPAPETPRPVVNPKPKRERTAKRDSGEAERTRHAPSAPASRASNGIGVGRSDADTNYRGLVAAHLSRHKQFPAAARDRGAQGSPSAAFSLDGAGRVTAARLARGSGIAELDQEVVAMVRRASPFPPPPNGRPASFTVPVNFRLW